jgi:hypothetical protein
MFRWQHTLLATCIDHGADPGALSWLHLEVCHLRQLLPQHRALQSDGNPPDSCQHHPSMSTLLQDECVAGHAAIGQATTVPKLAADLLLSALRQPCIIDGGVGEGRLADCGGVERRLPVPYEVQHLQTVNHSQSIWWGVALGCVPSLIPAVGSRPLRVLGCWGRYATNLALGLGPEQGEQRAAGRLRRQNAAAGRVLPRQLRCCRCCTANCDAHHHSSSAVETACVDYSECMSCCDRLAQCWQGGDTQRASSHQH